MERSLLSFDSCPDWQDTDRRLQQVVAAAGVDATVQHVDELTPEDAEQHGSRGSPTGRRERAAR